MTTITQKKQLVILRAGPYQSSLARAAVDLALAMGAFEQDFELLFLGDGVLQLLDAQQGEAIEQKTLGKMLASLPLYDVDSVYVDGQALARHALAVDDLVVPARSLDSAGIQALIQDCDHILSC